jgi:Helix-turn-helix domain
MIPEAREVRLLRKERKVLEARCRSPVTLQRDLKRARIVLLAAAGRSTRSIAKEVGIQPRIVSLWRHRFADWGLEGLTDKPRPGKEPVYTKTTSGSLGYWTSRHPKGLRDGQGHCSPRRSATLASNMSGGSCEATRSISRLANHGARATTPTLRPRQPMSPVSMWRRPTRRLCFASTKSLQSRR